MKKANNFQIAKAHLRVLLSFSFSANFSLALLIKMLLTKKYVSCDRKKTFLDEKNAFFIIFKGYHLVKKRKIENASFKKPSSRCQLISIFTLISFPFLGTPFILKLILNCPSEGKLPWCTTMLNQKLNVFSEDKESSSYYVIDIKFFHFLFSCSLLHCVMSYFCSYLMSDRKPQLDII